MRSKMPNLALALAAFSELRICPSVSVFLEGYDYEEAMRPNGFGINIYGVNL